MLLLTEEGVTFVLEAGDKYKEIAKNDLDEMSLASPAHGRQCDLHPDRVEAVQDRRVIGIQKVGAGSWQLISHHFQRRSEATGTLELEPRDAFDDHVVAQVVAADGKLGGQRRCRGRLVLARREVVWQRRAAEILA